MFQFAVFVVTLASLSSQGFAAFDKKEAYYILKAHNEYRKHVQPSASNMKELYWSGTMTKLAQAWTDRCEYAHPDTNVFQKYKELGQNLFRSSTKPDAVKPVDLWQAEVEDYDFHSNSCKKGKQCGHYTQMVWAETRAVGCGITHCPSGWIVACNYRVTGNRAGEKPYREGKSCTACSDGTCRKGLCRKCKVSSSKCECLTTCQNCAKLNDKCKCECFPGYHGPNCEEQCIDTHKDCNKSPGWPNKDACSLGDYVPMYCPAMCEVCEPAEKGEVCNE